MELFVHAKEYFIEAQQIDFKLNDYNGIANDLLNLGILHYHTNDFSKSIGLFKECISISEKYGYKEIISKAMCGIGNTYYRVYKEEQKMMNTDTDKAKQQRDKAKLHFIKALDMFQFKPTEMTSFAACFANLGFIFHDEGDKASAKKYLQNANGIYKKIDMQDPIMKDIESILIELEK